MKVFISWSGDKSHGVALGFRDWLPSVIQSIKPYVSSEDIDKGVRWSTDIAVELEDSNFGIICVTRDNLNAPWLSFEAGALSKTMDKSLVSPFLLDIKRSEVNGPMLQFQSTVFEKSDVQKLIRSLNRASKSPISDSRLDETFDVWYPKLEEVLKKLVLQTKASFSEDKESNSEPEMLEEILELSRSNQRLLKTPENKLLEAIVLLRDKVSEQEELIRDIKRGRSRDFKIKGKPLSPILIEELLHTLPVSALNGDGILVALGFFKTEMPWLYDSAKELLRHLRNSSSKAKKTKALAEFEELLVFSFQHPSMQDVLSITKGYDVYSVEIPRLIMSFFRYHSHEL